MSRDGAAIAAESRRGLIEQRLKAAEKGVGIPSRAEPFSPTPLSFAQERLWFLEQLAPGSSAYHVARVLRLAGPLVPAALGAAFAGLVERHHVLRSQVLATTSGPVQILMPRGDARMAAVDLGALHSSDQQLCLEGLARTEGKRPFHLERGQVLRFTLLALRPATWALLLTHHHIATDGWSMGVLLADLSVLYRRALEPGQPPLPPLPVQYADYALWQRQRLASRGPSGQLAWWRQQLAGAPPALELPTDRPRPAVQTFRGGRSLKRLSPQLTTGLNALASQEKGSLFVVLLAALAALLARWSGQDEVVVGTPVAGRDRKELEGLVGCFLNSLALRLEPRRGLSLRELVRGARQVAFGALAHQEVPFEQLLTELAVERDTSRTPLFQVTLNLLNFPRRRLDLPGVEAELTGHKEIEAKFDLTLYVREGEAGLDLNLIYNTDLFDPARMESFGEELEALLEAFVATPDRPLGSVSLVTARMAALLPDSRARLSARFEGTVVERFLAHAEAAPERPAVVVGAVIWTYGELAAATHRLARALNQAGLEPGERVAIFAHRSAPLPLAVMAALAAGGVMVLLDPAYPAARLVDFVELARPRALLALAAAGSLPEELAAALERIGCGIRFDLPPTTSVPALPLEVAGLPAHSLGVVLGPDSPAVVGFTSGSTGKPKGIVGRHGSLTHFIPWQAGRYGLDADDRYSLLSGLAHDPLQRDLFTPLVLGASIHVPAAERLGEPGYLAAWFASVGLTVAHLTPAMAQLLTTTAPNASAPTLHTLRLAFLVGDVLTGRDVRRLRALAPGLTVVNHYGSTETQRAVGYHVAGEVEDATVLPLGRGIVDVQLLVRKADGGLCAVGELGEIAIRSPHLALGYLADEALSAAHFESQPGDPADRLYKTGDLGRFLPNGEVAFAGRSDAQVQIRGFRVELGEVEAVLAAHPAVAAVAVLARESAELGRRLVAYVVSLEPLPAEELRRFAATRLPDFMVPSALVFLERLPLTPNGKLDRRALPEPSWGAAVGSTEEAPSTPLETQLAAWWGELLGLPRVGRNDDFFALGGHSLLATQLWARLAAGLEIKPPLRLLFEHPRLGDLATALAPLIAAGEGAGAIYPKLEPLAPGVVPPASFAQERLWFLRQLDGDDRAFHLASAFRLRGEILPATWARALRALTLRHGVLRARLVRVEGVLSQPLAEPSGQPVSWVDLSAVAPTELAGVEARLVAAEALTRFELSRGPLFRARLLRRAANEALLLLTLHHAVADGWSLSILVRDLSELYAATRLGRPVVLPELPATYGDFAAWQRQVLAGEVMGRLVELWRERLSGAAPLLELPTDRPRALSQGTISGRRGVLVPLAVPPEVVGGLHALARRKGATLFVTLLAGYGALLARWSGQREVVVGTPVANRALPEVEEVVGLFANLLALRLPLGGRPSLEQLVERARESALWAFAHGELPFERLVAELAPERDLSHTPIFQTALALQNTPRAAWQLPGLLLERLANPLESAQFDLALSVVEREGGLEGVCQYDAALFDGTTVQRFVVQLGRMLAAFAHSADRRLGEVVLLAPAERHQLLAEWSDTSLAQPEPATLPALFLSQASRTPDAVALVCADEFQSYGALLERARRGAEALARLGAGPEARVAVWAPRAVATVEMLLATTLAGAAYLPLEPGTPLERLRFFLEDSGPCCLATAVPLPPAFASELEARGLALLRWEVSATEQAGVPRLEAPLPDSLAYLLYTSGSTGKPKGVAVTHRNVVRLVTGGFANLGPQEVMLHIAAVPFDASTFEIWGSLLTGARLVVQPGLPALHELGEALATARVSTGFLTAGLFHQLVEEAPEALASFTQLLAGGEALSARAVFALVAGSHRVPSRAVINGYGPTECTTFALTHRMTSGLDLGPTVALGRPLGNTEVTIVDRDLRPTPLGVPGELAIGGLGLARAYWRRPGLTAERFVPTRGGGRLYLSGDRARQRADGLVEFLGRRDFQVKIRGFRIEMGEIEAALETHPAVGQAVVVAVAGSSGTLERLAAYVTPAAEEPRPSRGELVRHLGKHLPATMVPATITWLPALPLTPQGKVDRRRLPAPDLALHRPGYTPPATRHEETLAGLWEEVLGVDEVGRDDNFFVLGGHSLSVTRVFARLRSRFGVTMPLGVFFTHGTLASLAAELQKWTSQGLAASDSESPPAEAQNGDELPASYAQQGMWVFAQLDPGSTALHLPNTLEILGPLAVAPLAGALAIMVTRHQALSTVLVAEGGRLWQRRIDFPRPVLPVLDLSGLDAAVAARSWADRLGRRPMNLATGPLARFALLRLGPEAHQLSLTFHHIIADGWSDAVFVDEVCRLVRGESLPPAAQLADVVRQQERDLAGPLREVWLTSARERLAGLPTVLPLPTDRPRDLAGGHGSASVPVVLPAVLVSALAQLGGRTRATPFMTLLAGFGALLSRWTGLPELLLGTPLAGRTRPELEGIFGLVMNQVPLAVRAGGDPSFGELLRRMREEALAAFERQELPFELLVTELGLERTPALHPLYQALFALQNFPPNTWSLPGVAVRRLPTERGGTAVDLSLFLTEVGDTFEGSFELDTQLFDRTTLERLAGHFVSLLEGATTNPERRLSELPLLSPAEHQQLRIELSGVGRLLRESSPAVEQLVERQCRATPERVAVVACGRSPVVDECWSYGALLARSTELAGALIEAGAAPEQRVAVLAGRSFATVAALFAVMRSGAALVPLEVAAPVERSRQILLEAGAMALVARPEDAARLGGEHELPPRLDPWARGALAEGALPPAPENRLAYVMFTSGSTAKPKGVMVESACLAAFVAAAIREYGVGPGDRVLQLASLSFDACQEEIWPTLSTGATLVLRDADFLGSASHFLSRVAELSLTVLDLPTAFWHRLVAELEIDRRPLPPSLRLVILGGERAQPRPAALWSAWAAERGGPATVNSYGPTEVTVVATTWWLPRRSWGAGDPREVPIGRPLPGIVTVIVDRRLRPVALGTPGELLLGGAQVGRGYLDLPAKTADFYVPDAFSGRSGARLYRTGDLVRRLADGSLDYLDRLDLQLKVRGFRVEPKEIEELLITHAQVLQAVVVPWPGETGSVDRLAGYVVTRGEVAAAELRGFLTGRLPEVMIPAAFVPLERLPLTVAGKLALAALPAPQASRADEPMEAPSSSTEIFVAELWRGLLKVAEVGRHDSFFSLGGHSLLATRFLSQLERELDLQVPLRLLFNAPRLADFAAEVDELLLAAEGISSSGSEGLLPHC